ncbi:FAD synthase [Penicillium diatomitis]|uniref:FAD synthase n=1 Tax=Penicillium diatomitis TaxID=2819901 RepID=A0A9W9XC12_9EURO|nr:FAD synthase [Penicillium diatomitis]KAJ5488492.1 FAD synthase [Penicillium diatomitis]
MAQSVGTQSGSAASPLSTHASTSASDHLRPFRPVTTTPREQLPRGVDSAAAASPDQGSGLSATSIAQDRDSSVPESTSAEKDGNDVPPLPVVVAQIHARVQSFLDESHPPSSLLASVQRQTRMSLDVVAKALTKYKFSELSISYNGGKDCLVMLILFLAGLHPHLSATQSGPDSTTPQSIPATTPSTSTPSTSDQSEGSSETISEIPAIYALPPDPFDAVEDFVITSAQAYHLQVTKYTTAPPATTMRSCFEDYLAGHPGIRAIFVGTRRTDPHGGKLTHFDQTDHGWPDFMRIHPVIDWHYAEIWAFIRHLGLTYCSLYDMGYTSLGGTSDTHPNPRLRKVSETGSLSGGHTDAQTEYLPAYELTQDLEERLGRN